MESIPVDVKLRLLAGQMYAASEIGMWCFDLDRNLIYSTCSHEKEFLNFLRLSDCIEYLFSRENGWEKPVILSDSIGLVWIGEYIYRDGKPEYVILMGPMFLNRTSAKAIDEALKEKESSVFSRRQMARILNDVPVVMMPVMNLYALTLHYTIQNEKITSGDLYYQSDKKENGIRLFGEGISVASNRASAEREKSAEELIMQGIREGAPEFIRGLEKKVNETYGLASDTGDIIRDSKNTILIFNALCSRAAVEGGLPLKTAKEIESRYALETEKCDSVTKLTKLNNDLVHEYATRVRKCRENPQISMEIREACDYIKANILKDLTVEEIAKEAGYTTYYFTRKFYSEIGIRVTDYMKWAKIEYAKIELLSTKKGIQEISDALHFGTRNYFSTVFHEATGFSPTEFRERAEREGKNEAEKRY